MSSTSPVRIKTQPVVATNPASKVSHRQELIHGFSQDRLIGAGGIGSEVGEGLCRKGVGHLALFDHDIVEATNLNRQLFLPKDIGHPKAYRLALNLAQHCHAGTILEGSPLSFQDALASHLDLSAAVVVCGVDNSEARVTVSRHYRLSGTPVVFIAVDLLAECGHIFVQESRANTPCFGCAFPRSLVPRKAPCFVPASKDALKVTAGLALYAIDSLLMERKRNWNFRRVHLAGFAPDVIENLEKISGCPLCGNKQQGSSAVATATSGALPGSSPGPRV
jgi:hypothetical protein